jgi:hypothetical protein
MPCFDISALLKIEGGILYARDSCCEWVAIGSFQPGASSEDLGTEPLNPMEDPNVVYNACGKADALINKLVAVAETAWSTRDNPPWQYASEYHAAHPDLDGGTVSFTSSVILAIQLDLITSHDEVFDATQTQALKSWLAGILADDPAGLTESQYQELGRKIASTYAGGFNIFDPIKITTANFWGSTLDAIGPGDARNITQLGATTTADCGEPEQPLILFPGWGEGLAWSHIIDFRLATLPAGIVLRQADIDTIHTAGIGLWSEVSGTQDSTEVAFTLPMPAAATGAITRVGVAITTLGDDTFNPNLRMVFLDGPEDILMTGLALSNVAGQGPSVAGTWQIVGVCLGDYAGGAPTQLGFDLAAQHPPDTNPPSVPENSNILIALAIAGTGEDPYPLLP